MEVTDLIGLWPVVLSKAKARDLRGADVVEALRSEEPIPPAARALIADILEGNYKYKTGPAKLSFSGQVALVHYFVFLEGEGISKRKLKGETARTLAIEAIESGCGYSKRKIEGILSEHSGLLSSLRRSYAGSRS